MSIKDFNDISINMDSVNATKNTSWKTFFKYEFMNILHGLIAMARIGAILWILYYFWNSFFLISFLNIAKMNNSSILNDLLQLLI